MQITAATDQTSGTQRWMRTAGRWVAAAAIAMLVLTGLGIEASAEVVKMPDQGLSFEGNCKAGGGIYTETFEGGGNAWCQHADDTQTVCSLEGTDCYHISSQSQEPTGWANPLLDSTVDATITEDTQTVAPVDAPLEAVAAPVMEPVVEPSTVPAAEVIEEPAAAPAEESVAPMQEPVASSPEPVVAEEAVPVEAPS